MIPAADMPAAVALLPAVPVSRNFARTVNLRALFGLPRNRPLDPAAIRTSWPAFFQPTDRPYRFSRPGIRALYFGHDEGVTRMEVKQTGGGAGRVPFAPSAICWARANLPNVLDTTDVAVLKGLSASTDELAAPWRAPSPNAPTQLLGQALFDSGRFDGLLYWSAPAWKAGMQELCLAVFTDRLGPKAHLELWDDSGYFRDRLPP